MLSTDIDHELATTAVSYPFQGRENVGYMTYSVSTTAITIIVVIEAARHCRRQRSTDHPRHRESPSYKHASRTAVSSELDTGSGESRSSQSQRAETDSESSSGLLDGLHVGHGDDTSGSGGAGGTNWSKGGLYGAGLHFD